MDFCETTSQFSPTANSWFSVAPNAESIGFEAISELDKCSIILPQDENNMEIWDQLPEIINGRFKCARLQGANNFETFVVVIFQYFR